LKLYLFLFCLLVIKEFISLFQINMDFFQVFIKEEERDDDTKEISYNHHPSTFIKEEDHLAR
jgi:hypothetical protein